MAHWFQFGLPDAGTEMMMMVIFYHDLALMTIVGISVGMGYFLFSILKCPYWNKSIKKNEKLEFWWTVMPLVWLGFLSYPSLSNLYKMECVGHSADVMVKVVGHQWYWHYEYDFNPAGGYINNCPIPNIYEPFGTYGQWGQLEYEFKSKKGLKAWGGAKSLSDEDLFKSAKVTSFGYDSYMVSTDMLKFGDYRLLEVDHRLVLPKSTVMVSVTSADVIHSWSVPSLGIKIDAVPGKHNILMFKPMRVGVYYGQCSEICGVNHSYMPIVVEVIPLSNFNKWVGYMSAWSKGEPYTYWQNIFFRGWTDAEIKKRKEFQDEWYKKKGWEGSLVTDSMTDSMTDMKADSMADKVEEDKVIVKEEKNKMVDSVEEDIKSKYSNWMDF